MLWGENLGQIGRHFAGQKGLSGGALKAR